jgi:hypothetical protein
MPRLPEDARERQAGTSGQLFTDYAPLPKRPAPAPQEAGRLSGELIMGLLSKILKKKKDGKDGGAMTPVDQNPRRKDPNVFSAGAAQKKIEDRYKRINDIR